MKSNNRMFLMLAVFGSSLTFGGCTTDVPQAHRGQIFDRTGAVAFYTGGNGLTGPVIDPGTHFTGIYDEVRTVECGQLTPKETLGSLTRDNVQFNLDVYMRYSAVCSDEMVPVLLTTLVPNEHGMVTAAQLYSTYIRPSIGEATREVVSPYNANDINNNRDKILEDIRTRFLSMMAEKKPQAVTIHELNLSNLDFPKELDDANTSRAVQSILKDKAIAERDRVEAETKTETMRINLGRQKGLAVAAEIEEIGTALRKNPEYLQYDMQTKMPDIYKNAGEKGNLILTAPNPSILVTPRQ